jgi:hypothetical protein
MQKKGFLNRNEVSETKVNSFCFFEAKKGFPFVLLRSENNLVEVKRKEAKKMKMNFLIEQVKHM